MTMPADKLDVRAMVKEAGLDWYKGWTLSDEANRYEHFARLVLEEAAKVCKERAHMWGAIAPDMDSRMRALEYAKEREALDIAEAIESRMP